MEELEELVQRILQGEDYPVEKGSPAKGMELDLEEHSSKDGYEGRGPDQSPPAKDEEERTGFERKPSPNA